MQDVLWQCSSPFATRKELAALYGAVPDVLSWPSFEQQVARISQHSAGLTAQAEATCTQAWTNWAKEAFSGGASRAHRFTKPREQVEVPRTCASGQPSDLADLELQD